MWRRGAPVPGTATRKRQTHPPDSWWNLQAGCAKFQAGGRSGGPGEGRIELWALKKAAAPAATGAAERNVRCPQPFPHPFVACLAQLEEALTQWVAEHREAPLATHEEGAWKWCGRPCRGC
jgi:hypothetical protein